MLGRFWLEFDETDRPQKVAKDKLSQCIFRNVEVTQVNTPPQHLCVYYLLTYVGWMIFSCGFMWLACLLGDGSSVWHATYAWSGFLWVHYWCFPCVYIIMYILWDAYNHNVYFVLNVSHFYLYSKHVLYL